MAPHRSEPDPSGTHGTDWHAQELLLMREVMKLVGRSLAPAFVLREMLHLMSELLGYRFPGGRRDEGGLIETEPGGLGGHPVGNLGGGVDDPVVLGDRQAPGPKSFVRLGLPSDLEALPGPDPVTEHRQRPRRGHPGVLLPQ